MPMIFRVLLICAVACDAEARIALLIGIADYSARGLRTTGTPAPGRVWPDLPGPVNDVRAFAELLVHSYGFKRDDVIVLTDQQATREAILHALERHLVRRAHRNDVVLFYFAGHGSQVRNTLSDEQDRLDEAIVPADSSAGALDIRDKELRPYFNRILDRGARLTVILDNCHSGSGARAVHARGVSPDLRDVADRTRGPRPEDRGALVLSAAQDFARAFDMRDEKRAFRGVFSWALLRAMRDAAPGESAEETFLRAQARVKAERNDQDPVIAGNALARHTPLLGTRIERSERTTVAVTTVRNDGSVVLQGGWAHGLAVGMRLRAGASTLTVTDLCGPALSVAQSTSNAIRSGTLAEILHPIAPPWHRLASPPSPWQLLIRDTRTRQNVMQVIGNRRYELVARPAPSAPNEKRYLYAFAIDAAGKHILLFPRHGSVENFFAPAAELPLAQFRGAPPYGVDLFLLMTTDIPLPNPWILQWDGVRSPPARANWSVERLSVESVPARRYKIGDPVSLSY